MLPVQPAIETSSTGKASQPKDSTEHRVPDQGTQPPASATSENIPQQSNPIQAPIQSRFTIFIRLVKLVFGTLGTMVLVLFMIRSFIVSAEQVNGRSMEPTYKDNEMFFVNKFVYLFSAPQRYDVIQLQDTSESKFIIKRVIGLPGETVQIRAGSVRVFDTSKNPIPLDESPYLDASVRTYIPNTTTTSEWTLAPGSYFVLGDNRPKSTDSRGYGPVDRSYIIGRVIGFVRRNKH